MDLEELSQRLGSLEAARQEDMQKAAQEAFMNKYGSRISNNDGLGLIILNELNRRGVDTSAADEAVTQILDQLRMEATTLLDTIKEDMNQASGLIDKIDAMDQSVQAAAAASGGVPEAMPTQAMQTPAPDAQMPPAPDMGAGAPDMGAPVPEEPAPEAPPAPDAPAPDMGAAPDMPPPEQGLPPDAAVSDANKKEIISPKRLIISDATMKRIKVTRPKEPAKPTGYTPSAGVLAACQGGW